ncbi:hypothetical protein [Thermococcus sp. JdF3]|uniref:hypothetical protein n=1 Tax=Thermococcus sp. JdF3 TaxID=1638258 RepID=UPI001F0E3C2E|nr:hypothetical protein [Thermococcus sp. JdF3]
MKMGLKRVAQRSPFRPHQSVRPSLIIAGGDWKRGLKRLPKKIRRAIHNSHDRWKIFKFPFPAPYDKIKARIEGTGFTLVSDYVTYVFREFLASLKEEEKEEAFTDFHRG